MKKIVLLGLMMVLLSSLFAEDDRFRLGVVLNYYNEPALRPGVSFGLDWELPLIASWRVGMVLPEVTYFYFPDNYEAWYLYPELSLRYAGRRGGFFSLGAGGGLSLSRKVVPVYNIEGELINDPFTRQLVLMVQAYFGIDYSQRPSSKPFRVYGSIGWKGLYPNNLRFQNQPMMQIGINYRINRKHDKKGLVVRGAYCSAMQPGNA